MWWKWAFVATCLVLACVERTVAGAVDRDLDPARTAIEEKGSDAYPGSERAAWTLIRFVEENAAISLRVANRLGASAEADLHIWALDEDPVGMMMWFSGQGSDMRSMSEAAPKTYPIEGVRIVEAIPENTFAPGDGRTYQRTRLQVVVPQTKIDGIATVAEISRELIVSWSIEPN